MGFQARFERGANYIDLTTGGYSIMGDFMPPGTQENSNIAFGTALNVTGGGEVISKTAANIEFSFTVRALGGSDAECSNLIDRLAWFVRQNDDPNLPLYFCYRSDDAYLYEPLWGQTGAFRRLEVLGAGVQKTGPYASPVKEIAQLATVSLLTKPYALGKRQRMGEATGAVLEDIVGVPEGKSRGAYLVQNGLYNLFTNPIFGNAIWNTGWTSSHADMAAEQNLVREFLLYGKSSARLVNSSASSQTYLQNVTFGNVNDHAIWCYVRKPGGSAVTSSDIQIYFNAAALTTTFVSVGNGWYWAWAAVVGVVAATAGGIQVKADRTVYVDGFMASSSNVTSPHHNYFYGDQLGCRWSGTAHASSSLCWGAATYIRVTGIESFKGTAGTVRMVYQHKSDQFFYMWDTGAYQLRFGSNADRYTFTDGTNSVLSSEVARTNGEVIIIHSVYDKTSGLALYVNGVADGTNASINTTATPTYLYIGSDDVSSNLMDGTIMDFATFDRPMTATEIAADYANLSEATDAGRKLAGIPYIWTKDGDNIVDQYDDATHDDFAIAAGIPGTAPADTVLHLKASSPDASYLISNQIFNRYLDMNAGHKAPAETISVNTTEVDFPALAADKISFSQDREAYYNRQAYIFATVTDVGTTLQGRLRSNFSSALVVSGEFQSLAADVTDRQFVIGPIYVPSGPDVRYEWAGTASNLKFYLGFKRTTAGAANVTLGTYRLLIGQVAYIYVTGSNTQEVILSGGRAWGYDVGYTQQIEYPVYRGDPIEFEPDKINHVVIKSGDLAGAYNSAKTVTIQRAYVIPRYLLL